MCFGKNLENLDSAIQECDRICFGPLGPMLYQVDIPWTFSRAPVVSVWDVNNLN